MKYLVTGGNSGIGLAVSRLLIAEGHEVISLSRKRKEVLDLSDKAYIQLICDISKDDEILQAKKNLKELNQLRIDGIFLNAGFYTESNLDEITFDLFLKVFVTNFYGNLSVLKNFRDCMEESSLKAVVINSSDQVKIGKKSSILYGASKAAVAHLAKSLTADYAKYKIRINSILPGGTRTDLYKKAQESKSDKEKAVSETKYPLGRTADTEEIAELVVFLLSSKSSFISGADISIDGGLSAI